MTALAFRHSQDDTPPRIDRADDALWDRYEKTRDPAARRALLDRHLGLVHHAARDVAARTPMMEIDDLVSAGTIGLVRALESFDRSRGLAFSTYAVRRIRGAILDDLRSRDWIPRSVRAKGRRMAQAVAVLERELRRTPAPSEVALCLGIDLTTYWNWRGAVDGGLLVSFDGTAGGTGGALTLEETLDDPSAPAPGDELQRDEEAQGLRRAIGTLPEKERLVLSLYYYEELNLRQIAEVLHVTESRISQIRTQALRRLRQRLTPAAP
jgi:RNA polymerase sigma factor for flagellar operon FliA